MEEVRLVRWPDEASARDAAAASGTPCLLVIAAGTSIPPTLQHEDWIRDTADERDVAARLDGLRRRATAAGGGRLAEVVPAPHVPAGLEAGDRRAARVLLSQPGRVVPRDELCDMHGGPLGASSIRRLRRALRPDGWELHLVGERGLLVDRVPS